MNIILCGMPGSGKSYFGALAAQQLNRIFIDTDELVMSAYFKLKHQQLTCREITLKEGEPFFRQLESKVLKELELVRHSIIALGGGTLCTPENIQVVKNLGRVIYLKVPPKTLLERLTSKKTLPSYLDQADIEGSFNALLKQRLPIFEQNCHHCVDVGSENVLEIIILQNYIPTSE
jgi:shikimate kinase